MGGGTVHCRHEDGIGEIAWAVGVQGVAGPLRAGQHYWPRIVVDQIQQDRRFLHRVGPVRDDNAVDRIAAPGQQRRDSVADGADVLQRHAVGTHRHQVVGYHLDAGDVGALEQVGGRPCRHDAAIGGGGGDGAAGGDHRDAGHRVNTGPALSRRSAVDACFG